MKYSNSKLIIAFCFAFFSIRIFSYLFSPPTPLQDSHMINNSLSLIILIISLTLIAKNILLGWLIIAGEMILGGSGGYFSIGILSLRTSLLIGSIIFFIISEFIKDKCFYKKYYNDKIAITLCLLIFWMIISAIVGFINNNSISIIFSNLIPYFFLLYYFPLKYLLQNEDFKKYIWLMITSSIICNALFIIFTLFVFSYGYFAEQGNYYHWFRDVALGKITDLKTGFFRIVLNEHLLLPIFILIVIYKKIKNQYVNYFYLIIPLFIILAINLTRIFFLSIIIAILLFFLYLPIKRTIKILTTCLVGFIVIFSFIHYTSTNFQSFGWEFFGVRLASIATPHIEDSSLSRMLLLPVIIEKISLQPFIGSGLGSVISVYSPVFRKIITTEHFDWGYLEIIAETGIIGFIIWLLFISQIFNQLLKKENCHYSLLIPILISILIINITSPALFHVFGILLLIIIASLANYSSINNQDKSLCA